MWPHVHEPADQWHVLVSHGYGPEKVVYVTEVLVGGGWKANDVCWPRQCGHKQKKTQGVVAPPAAASARAASAVTVRDRTGLFTAASLHQKVLYYTSSHSLIFNRLSGVGSRRQTLAPGVRMVY